MILVFKGITFVTLNYTFYLALVHSVETNVILTRPDTTRGSDLAYLWFLPGCFGGYNGH